ncbi:MAG: hypothetical protein ACKO6N_13805 [Myxococcota bacterium]
MSHNNTPSSRRWGLALLAWMGWVSIGLLETSAPGASAGHAVTAAWSISSAAAASAKAPAVPNDLQLVNGLKKSWNGISCMGELAISMGGSVQLAAPLAIAYNKDVLNWVAFITPPTPCAGTVVQGGVKTGPGNQPSLMMGVPPGMVVGGGPALLSWKKIETKKTPNGQPANVGSLCSGGGGGGSEDLFSGFTGGLGERPEKRSWDSENPNLLKMEGQLKGEEKAQQGRYTVWLDKSKGWLPVRNEKYPELGAASVTVLEPKEVSPGRWLPARWETTGPGRPTLVGEFKNLRCDKPVPESWFKTATFPDVSSQKAVLQQIQQR